VPTRRRFLAAVALGLAGCSSPGSDPEGLGTLGSVVGRQGAQRLDPVLRLSVPEGAIPSRVVTAFSSRTGVRVDVSTHSSDAEVVLELATAGESPPFDAILVEQETLAQLVTASAVETLARRLIPNRKLIAKPWSDPPFDHGGHHSVPQSYTPIGYALAPGVVTAPAGTWSGFFALAAAEPRQVAIPDDPDVVIGAALVAAGHSWSSADAADLAAVRAILAPLAHALRVDGGIDRSSLGGMHAVLASGAGFRFERPAGMRFVVPVDGTVTRTRLWCIPAYSAAPASAHAWFDHVLDPLNAADAVRASGLASPVLAAAYLLPASVLADTAVYVPAATLPDIAFQNLTDEGKAARRALWSEIFPEAAPGRM
jgi:spermidine/putrescine-binding protein